MSKVDWEKILKQSGGKVRDDSSGFFFFHPRSLSFT